MTDDLSFALIRLGDESKPVRTISLAPLSDLSRSQTGLFRSAWANLATERRFELISELVEQAEVNVRFNFSAILRELLSDPDARVRKLAVEGLWEDNRSSLVTLMTNRLLQDPAPEVRAAAAISLGRFVLMGELSEIPEIAAQQSIDALRAAWTRPQEVTEVRRRALEALAYTGTADVRELIDNAYYDDDDALRQSAVFAMGRSADRHWAKPVLTELASQDAAMRFEAAAAAGELALTAALRPLIRLLDDSDSNVREAAAVALGQIGGPEARRALEACAAGEDVRLAEAAQEALEELVFNSGTIETPLLEVSGHDTNGWAPAGAAVEDEDEDLDEDYDGPLDEEELDGDEEEDVFDEDEDWDGEDWDGEEDPEEDEEDWDEDLID